jgi:ectoine hydroxylase-related dioxygenase (phytanoyl-CoA dioxygenase family)
MELGFLTVCLPESDLTGVAHQAAHQDFAAVRSRSLTDFG